MGRGYCCAGGHNDKALLSYLGDEHIPLLYKLARANQHTKVLFHSMHDHSDPNPRRLKEVWRDGRIFANIPSIEPPPPILALAFRPN